MKKVVVFLMTAIICFICSAVCVFAQYDGNNIDYDYYCSYYFDCDGDGIDETLFNVTYDLEDNTVCIRDFNSPLNHIVIPEIMSIEIYDYDSYEYVTEKFTVTSINGTDSEYYESEITSVEVPHTVNKIAPKTLGYYFTYDDEGNEVPEPVKNFKIYCTENTAAHTYAIENRFEYECFKNISDTTVSLDKYTYTYTGFSIEPGVKLTTKTEILKENVDYTVEYKNNLNKGSASVYITGTGKYRGVVTCSFEISAKPVDAADISVTDEVGYTGYALRPSVSVSFNGSVLSFGTDYKTSYSSNIEPGTAYIQISFCGNFSGTAKVSFKIVLGKIASFNAVSVTSTSVKLTWTNVKCDDFIIFKYNAASKKYVIIKKIKTNTYTDNGLSQLTHCYYRVRAVKYNSDKTNTYGPIISADCVTKLTTPAVIKLATINKAATVTWTRNTKASGYQIYRADWFSEFRLIRLITDKTVGSYKNTGLDNENNYFYKVRSYRKVNGATYYSDFTEVRASADTSSILEAASLKPRTSFKVYNRQGKSTTSWTYYLSDNDIRILNKFKASHFAPGMSREDVLRITLNWINLNVTYAVNSDWNKISGKSWVDAIFTYKLGQCAQYNGAMAAMMAYLGYDSCVVQGYRGTWSSNYWQHFWCEVNIGGRIYVMETGNYGCDGTWSYFLAPYSETRRYIRNQENM